MTPLAVCRIQDLAASAKAPQWLIEGLWGDQAVGIIGGEPKSGKSLLALDLAVAVASGAPCLRRFPPAQTGRVLLFAAEDALPLVRHRLEGIARVAEVAFDALDIHVITTPSLRLDLAEDRDRLHATVATLRPCSSATLWCGCIGSTRTPWSRSRPCLPASAAARVRDRRRPGPPRPRGRSPPPRRPSSALEGRCCPTMGKQRPIG